jgi:rare lipoprotein A (peptidoglycan hydrolase)
MQKYLLLIIVFFLCACAFEEENNKKFIKRKYRTKPSESMQIGLPKENMYSTKEFSIIKINNNKPKIEETIQNQEKSEDNFDNPSYYPNNLPYNGIFKIGKPYKAFDIIYTPQNYETFEETGTASWYGKDFHGKTTANGEIYNIGDLTAAHPTLPLPSIIKITNLDNNKSQVVRVNDRGPFTKNRVIDVSERTAEILDFKNKGTAKVKIQLLRAETDKMLEMFGLNED